MKLPRRPAAVIFDMDGLIFDTETLYQEAFLVAATAGGHDLPATVIQRTIGVPWTRSRLMLLEHMGSNFPVDHYFTQVIGHFESLAATQLRLKPGVVELLDLLDRLAMPRCIATSSAHATVQSHLAAHRLTDRFHTVVGHGDYAASKPAPDPFLTAAKRLGVAPALCLALEDSHNGVRSASAAGMMTVMVPDLLGATPEIRSLCTGVVDDLHAVCALIQAASTAAVAG
ncbi:MAG: HAD family phosphatase [Reyranella sp.]|uniref:HAD family hydrolase n=1 Tax=Reyranella sp. TaxID=1929291 RepID=UPI0025D13970|nr:HAD family phosphatase [Reyranella sp.]MBR2818040.1 HAD family phosphatase [Reyranella sp.]